MSPPLNPSQRVSEAAQRNRAPIFERLEPLLRQALERWGELKMLEVASGTGQHAAYFASRCPQLTVQPTDLDLTNAESVAAWAQEAQVSERVSPLRALDVSDPSALWPLERPQLIYCANMVHIAPWAAAEGLFKGAGERLSSGAHLVTYGPYRLPHSPLAPSNVAFDQSLRERDERWGIRELSALDELADRAGLRRVELCELPANNHLLIYERA